MEEHKKYYDYAIMNFSLDKIYERNRYLDKLIYSKSHPAEILEVKVTEKGIYISYRFELTEESYKIRKNLLKGENKNDNN